MGFPTVAAFCRAHGVCQGVMGEYENFRNYPRTEYMIKKMEKIFRCDIDDLFPPECRDAVNRNMGRPVEKIVEIKELPPYMEKAYLLPSPQELYEEAESREMIEEALLTLTEREAKILKLRYFEDMELSQIAQRFLVSRERIRQIEKKALRKLKHPARSRKLRTALKIKGDKT